jgi:hypothetical protein
MILGAKSSCYVRSRSICRQLWTYGELLNKFMDLKCIFEVMDLNVTSIQVDGHLVHFNHF